jgi:thymidylate kinase
LIFTLEGIDASGKATQAKMLTEALTKMNTVTTAFDFPRYQSRTGSAILGLLTGKWGVKTSAIEQIYEINVGDIPPEKVADWIELVRRGLHTYDVQHELIPPEKVTVRVRETERAKNEDEIRALVLQSLMTTNRLEVFQLLAQHAKHPEIHLVLDRYYTSGLVYGNADGLPMDYLLNIHSALPPSDLWVFIDIPPEESRKRRPERRDEYERRAGFMEKVALGYMELFRVAIPNKPAGKWVVVDGLGTAEEVHERIMNEVRSIL